MINLIVGFVLGFFVATMGLTGVAQAIDSVIDKVKTTNITIESK
jgi:uncharacterized membrane protein required for colicin V production